MLENEPAEVNGLIKSLDNLLLTVIEKNDHYIKM